MKKQCIVKYDDLEKPIELLEVKEFIDPQTLNNFKEKCVENKKAYLKRLEEKAEKERLEKEEVHKEIQDLYDENKSLKSVILHLLGYKELDENEIKEILGVIEHEQD